MDRKTSGEEEEAKPREAAEQSSDPLEGLFSRNTDPKRLPKLREGMKYMRLVIKGETGGHTKIPVTVRTGDETFELESGMYVAVNEKGFAVNETVKGLLKDRDGMYELEELTSDEDETGTEKEAA